MHEAPRRHKPAQGARGAPSGNAQDGPAPFPIRAIFEDPEEFAQNVSHILFHASKAFSTFLNHSAKSETREDLSVSLGTVVSVLSHIGNYWMSDQSRLAHAQNRLWSSYAQLWQSTADRLSGKMPAPAIEPAPGDRRFFDPQWRDNEMLDFVKQFYLLTGRWVHELVRDADNVDEHTRHQARFYVEQIIAALSPTNFIGSNPAILRKAMETRGASLAEGLAKFAEDMALGEGELKLRHVPRAAFAIGTDIAATPGKVVARNELCEIIQYAPSTDHVARRPLLVVPPWINKYYVLDLSPQKSFIKWTVDQGHTVFVISWVNPDTRLRNKGFEHYGERGIEFALQTIESVTGQQSINALGYCVGGTLLSLCLARMAQHGDRRIAGVTLLTTQVDFDQAGDLKVFIDENQIREIERKMKRTGYLRGSDMASAFNLLRANDLIWPYIVNNYLLGNEPAPLDLLFWNADSMRIAEANHSFYLRECYLHNRIAKGEMMFGGTRIDLARIRQPVYMLATEEDHIAPARSVYRGARCFGGKMRFVLAGSGHIAGVVNHPERNKYGYRRGAMRARTLDKWRASATAFQGSWWPDWMEWLNQRAGGEVRARIPGEGPDGAAMPVLADAPGSYVQVRCDGPAAT